jgi:hypothetical protein
VTVSSDVGMSPFLQVVLVFPSPSLVNFVHGILYIHGQLSENLQNHKGGFRNNFRSHWQLPESRNKLSEESYWKDFYN